MLNNTRPCLKVRTFSLNNQTFIEQGLTNLVACVLKKTCCKDLRCEDDTNVLTVLSIVYSTNSTALSNFKCSLIFILERDG